MAMQLLTRMRKQSVWVWDNPVANDAGGFSYDAPIHVLGRWDDEQILFLNEAGEEEMSKALVYLGMDPALGAMLMLDEGWADSSGVVPADPFDSSVVAWPIKAFRKNPVLGASETTTPNNALRTCIL